MATTQADQPVSTPELADWIRDLSFGGKQLTAGHARALAQFITAKYTIQTRESARGSAVFSQMSDVSGG